MVAKPERKNPLGYLDIYGRIILKFSLKGIGREDEKSVHPAHERGLAEIR